MRVRHRLMRTSRKERTSRSKHRKQTATIAKGIDWKPQPPRKITEALDAVYASEDSKLDPMIERMVWLALAGVEW